MKIDDISQQINQMKSLESPVSKKTQEENTHEARKSDPGMQTGTKIDISSASVEVSRAAEMMDALPVERAQRIEELKTMIDNGTYNIDAKKIADRILSDPFADLI